MCLNFFVTSQDEEMKTTPKTIFLLLFSCGHSSLQTAISVDFSIMVQIDNYITTTATTKQLNWRKNVWETKQIKKKTGENFLVLF